jgi:fucose 4-O-acetylase-like acetyltransferase
MSTDFQPQTKKQRIEYFDLLKGIAIFLVVMGHVLTICIRDIDSAFLFKIIGETHMPIFFFISGYLTYKMTESRTFAAPNMKKRFCQLMIPFFIVTALWVLYFPHSHLMSPLSDNLPDLYRAYWKDGYWFTLCLFELFLIYFPLSYVMSKLKSTWQQIGVTIIIYAILVVLAINFSSEDNNVDYAGVGLLARFFPIFIMGLFAHKMKEAFNRTFHNEYFLLGAIIVFGFTWYTLVYPWEFPWIPDWVQFITRPVMQLAVIIVAFSLAEQWANHEYHTEGHKPSMTARYFDYLGRESLGIYMLHYFSLFPLTPLQEPLKMIDLSNVPLTVVSAVVAFCVIGFTLFVIQIIKRSRWLSFLLIGKSLN